MREERELRIHTSAGILMLKAPSPDAVREKVAEIFIELIDPKNHNLIARRWIILTVEKDKIELLASFT